MPLARMGIGIATAENGASLEGSEAKVPPTTAGAEKMRVRSLGGEDPLEEGMATHSSILAWRATVCGITELDTTAAT